jgi:hypothetical protein
MTMQKDVLLSGQRHAAVPDIDVGQILFAHGFKLAFPARRDDERSQ